MWLLRRRAGLHLTVAKNIETRAVAIEQLIVFEIEPFLQGFLRDRGHVETPLSTI